MKDFLSSREDGVAMLGSIIGIAFAVIFGVTLYATIAPMINNSTVPQHVQNESWTSPATCGSWGTLGHSNLVANSTVAANGTIQLNNTEFWTNASTGGAYAYCTIPSNASRHFPGVVYNVSYNYYGANYETNSNNRSLLTLLPTLFALLVLMSIIGGFGLFAGRKGGGE